MNLRSPKTEAVATYLELKNDPESGANDIQVLEPSLDRRRPDRRQAARAAAGRARD